MTIRLNWEVRKGYLTVFFDGGFQLSVLQRDNAWRPTKRWRVWYGTDEPPIRGLTDRWFRSARAAQYAAERVFVPMLTIAPKLLRVEASITGSGAWLHEPKPIKRQ